ncbi:MAG: flagellar hook protein FlgE [Clostridiaceae bacterium]|nr:flagellar hook protein FlgE [Clostridiaceae bacterium]
MMRSMFSAVSGLRSHQLRMDAIGNNIANVNTVGYKGTRVTFQEVFSQTISGAGSPQEGRGGTNPQQVGLGMTIASMDTIHTRGAIETTDVNTDLMIDGNGFFMVSGDPNFLERSYTRAGMFTEDAVGNLVTPDGLKVLGYQADHNGVLGTNIEGLKIPKDEAYPAEVTKNVRMSGNLNSETKIMDELDPAPGARVAENADDDAVYLMRKREVNGEPITYYELNSEYKDAVARETTFEVYDPLGGIHEIKQVFIKIEDPAGNSQFAVETFYIEPNGNMIHAGPEDVSIENGNDVTLGFNTAGELTDDTRAMRLSIPDRLTNGAGEFEFEINYSNLTMFANSSSVSAREVDGYKQGTLVDFTIANTGEITGYFDNGQMRVLGQVALANFSNPAGLEKTGSNLYRASNNSGRAVVGTPGKDGLGVIRAGSLEMSNVDLSREFSNMITTQRGFQANSRVITTSDEMIQEVVNMKR